MQCVVNVMSDAIRQPLVSVMGHVDHGKTSLLDAIRGTTVVEREAGRITQHIGATEVPIETIYEICGKLIGDRKFRVPGLLFIDTPGHHSFTTLRSRGGALSDLAILVIDINEGLKPQTVESINILKRTKTPFVIALNKIDALNGWRPGRNRPFITGFREQHEEVQRTLDERLYAIAGRLFDHGFSADRYDKVIDFTKNVAMVPVSAKHSEGIADLLLVLVGLAQKFLEENLRTEEGAAEGTVLEIKEEKGLGATLDLILYKGTLNRGDTVAVGSTNGKPIVTKIKAILRPKPLDEIRSPQEKFNSVKSAGAAAGLKISAPGIEDALAGSMLKVIGQGESAEEVIREIEQESKATVELSDDGVVLKADAIGSLEAIAFECKNAGIPIKNAEVGDISRHDVVEASALTDPLHRIIFGFNVDVLPDAKDEIVKTGLTVLQSDIIYKLIEDYEKWAAKRKTDLEKDRRKEVVFPAKVKVLPGCVFRVSKPAIVGMRVLGGKLRSGEGLLREDGKEVGSIRSIQSDNKSISEAIMGQEIAVAIEGATVGRQLDENDVLYVDIPEGHVKKLGDYELTFEEKEALQKVIELKRKEKPFWGM
jgi:translation initiation factor 5B